MSLTVFAPAKVNLALHVTGRRADGYHLLDSLVVFAPFGDQLRIDRADALTLTVSGPEARGVPEGPENLILRAAAFVGATGARTRLDKRLPAASGIGGGSSDAAAMLRGLAALGAPLPGGLERLGADVPMCLSPRPARVQGVGEEIVPVDLPGLPALLVNPRVAVSTPAVFGALERRDNPGLPALRAFRDAGDLIGWLGGARNDLEAPATALAPAIGVALADLRALPGCRLARMSGSGATCFALFQAMPEAEAALTMMRARRPDWWAAAGLLGDQRGRAAARPL